MNDFQLMIKDICDEEGINFSIISKDWIMVLEKDNKVRTIVGCKFDSNNHGMGLTLDDKFATYEMLRKFDFPVVHHEILYSPWNFRKFAKGCNNFSYAHDFFKRNNNDIVIKINEGFQGKGVYHITDENEIDELLDKLFIKNFSLSLCPFCHIKNEYRLIMLDNEPMIVYQKIKPQIVGDGIHTIKELLIELNEHFFIDKNDDVINEVLGKGETFEYNWKFNLSGGAIINVDFDPELKSKLIDLAKSITTKLGLGFVSVDIIQLENGDIEVLEINSGVATMHFRHIQDGGYEIAKDMYRKAVIKMFQ